MAQPSVNACAVNEAQAEPSFRDTLRQALPAHAHVTETRNAKTLGSKFVVTWSTPGAMWTVDVDGFAGDVRPNLVRVTDPGSGHDNRWEFEKPSAGDVITFLRGARAFFQPAPAFNAFTSGVRGQTEGQTFADALRPYLPDHAKVNTKQPTHLQTFVLSVGSPAAEPPAREFFTADWTTGSGRWQVTLNAVDPFRPGVTVTGIKGHWWWPTADIFALVSFLRGVGAVPHDNPEKRVAGPDFFSDLDDWLSSKRRRFERESQDRRRRDRVADRAARYGGELLRALAETTQEAGVAPMHEAARRLAELTETELEESRRG